MTRGDLLNIVQAAATLAVRASMSGFAPEFMLSKKDATMTGTAGVKASMESTL